MSAAAWFLLAPFIAGGDWRTLDGELPKEPAKTYESLDAVETEMRPGACGCRVRGARARSGLRLAMVVTMWALLTVTRRRRRQS